LIRPFSESCGRFDRIPDGTIDAWGDALDDAGVDVLSVVVANGLLRIESVLEELLFK
jgi:hypothetical protein